MRYSKTSYWDALAAISRGMSPSFVYSVKLALYISYRNLTVSTWPNFVAIISGVSPHLFFLLTSAPKAINNGIDSKASLEAETCKGVFKSLSNDSTFIPFSNKNYTIIGLSFAQVPIFLPYLPPFGPKDALCKASLPYLSAALILIPGHVTRYSITSNSPKKEDFEKGVLPSLVGALTLTPYDYNSFTIFIWPLEHA